MKDDLKSRLNFRKLENKFRLLQEQKEMRQQRGRILHWNHPQNHRKNQLQASSRITGIFRGHALCHRLQRHHRRRTLLPHRLHVHQHQTGTPHQVMWESLFY